MQIFNKENAIFYSSGSIHVVQARPIQLIEKAL